MHRFRSLAVMLSLFVVVAVAAKDARKELVVTLRFTPQEGVQTTSPALAPDLLQRAVDLHVDDARHLTDPTVIGDGTNGDDESFPIRASSDVVAFVDATIQSVAKDWSIATGSKERVLAISITHFSVNESNKAVGSIYAADVKLAFDLRDGKGRSLARGIGAGEAHRYGRARSGDNCNEVLSDALKDAFAGVLSDSALQSAWMSGKASGTAAAASAAEPKESPEERLKKLESLYKKGVITKEEYERKRAEIIKEL